MLFTSIPCKAWIHPTKGNLFYQQLIIISLKVHCITNKFTSYLYQSQIKDSGGLYKFMELWKQTLYFLHNVIKSRMS